MTNIQNYLETVVTAGQLLESLKFNFDVEPDQDGKKHTLVFDELHYGVVKGPSPSFEEMKDALRATAKNCLNKLSDTGSTIPELLLMDSISFIGNFDIDRETGSICDSGGVRHWVNDYEQYAGVVSAIHTLTRKAA